MCKEHCHMTWGTKECTERITAVRSQNSVCIFQNFKEEPRQFCVKRTLSVFGKKRVRLWKKNNFWKKIFFSVKIRFSDQYFVLTCVFLQNLDQLRFRRFPVDILFYTIRIQKVSCRYSILHHKKYNRKLQPTHFLQNLVILKKITRHVHQLI